MPPDDNGLLWVNTIPFVGVAFLGLLICSLGVLASVDLARSILRLRCRIPKHPAPPAPKPSLLPVKKLDPSSRVLCYKCAHANAVTVERCEACGHSLYVECHCGARNLRANDLCATCGERLRRRRINPDDPMFDPLGGPVFGPAGGSSSPNDLVAAAFVFAVVGLIFAIALGYPQLEELAEQRSIRRQEHEQQLSNSRDQIELGEILRRGGQHFQTPVIFNPDSFTKPLLPGGL